MAAVRYEAGALANLLTMYAEALKQPNLKSLSEAGQPIDVPEEDREAALKAVQEASVAMGRLCQQRVLGIVVNFP